MGSCVNCCLLKCQLPRGKLPVYRTQNIMFFHGNSSCINMYVYRLMVNLPHTELEMQTVKFRTLLTKTGCLLLL